MITQLASIAKVSIGYKSLQNAFFYVNEATIDTFGIEKRFLIPVLKMRNMNARRFVQASKAQLWLFTCKEKIDDMRGTGALRYIEAMANHAAKKKKQSGKDLTVREALSAQSGKVWYEPKAQPHQHHVWVRKAFNGVYAPFLFNEAVLVDQRCNSIEPRKGFNWQEIGAVLTSTLFAYSVEINGSVSMGAGALEAPTTKLSEYPVLDLAQMNEAQRKKLVTLAETIWKKEPPLDWSQPNVAPGPHMCTLDKWILSLIGRGVKIETLYADVHEVCQSRLTVAKDKGRKTKKSKAKNIGNVAESITKAILPKIRSRNFPDDFAETTLSDISFNFDRESLQRIKITPFMNTCHIEVFAQGGDIAYEQSLPRAVAETIVRALLWGRSSFSVGSDPKVMDKVLNKFIPWAAEIEKDVETAIRNSAFGTGYEEALKREVYSRLGIHPMAGMKNLPTEITM